MTNDVEAIKHRLDIVDVIRDYLTLKQSGAHFKATCPFHHEKSASFMVNREKQIWHCFGCSEGGDIFTFVQRIENIDFREALQLLAEKAGIELSSGVRSEVNKNERTRLLEMLQIAANVYHRILCELPGAAGAREYLEKRLVSSAILGSFQVGFAPTGWDVITQYFLKKGFTIEDCVKAGLTIAKTEGRRGYFDRFRSRIMFPIWDTHGRVIGFTGRVLVETKDSGGKYMNTPETPLFHKGNVVYAIHYAKQAIKEAGYTVLVEGQMDVIACHQAGMKQVVACSGTALTVEQLRLLKRYTDELRIAFDADAAGQAAAERSIAIALAEGFVVKIIRIPEGAGKDADECIKKDPAIWSEAVKAAKPFMEHMMTQLIPEDRRADLQKDPRRKHQVSQKIVSFIKLLPSAIERDHWIQQASLLLQTGAEALTELMRRIQTSTLDQSAQKPIEDKLEREAKRSRQIRSQLEERILALLQQEFSLFEEVRHVLPEDVIIDDTYRALYKEWTDQYTTGTTPKSGAPVKDSTLELLVAASYSEMGQKERQAELRALTKRLREIYLTEHRETLIHEIQRAESTGDQPRLKTLLERYQKLIV